MPKLNWKEIGIGLIIVFFGFQLVSLILKSVFPSTSIFSRIVSGYSLAWIWILLGLIILIVGFFIFNIKNFDKRSVFIGLTSLAILSFIIIYFDIDLGKAFNMSIAQNQLGSLVSPVLGTSTIGSTISVGDTFGNVWFGVGAFGQGAILVIVLITLISIVINKK